MYMLFVVHLDHIGDLVHHRARVRLVESTRFVFLLCFLLSFEITLIPAFFGFLLSMPIYCDLEKGGSWFVVMV